MRISDWSSDVCSSDLPDVNDPGYRAITWEQLYAAYSEQVSGLIDGGADIILIETVFDTLNCKVALYAANEQFAKKGKQLPLMVSGTNTDRSEEHTSELQSLMRISSAVFYS